MNVGEEQNCAGTSGHEHTRDPEAMHPRGRPSAPRRRRGAQRVPVDDASSLDPARSFACLRCRRADLRRAARGRASSLRRVDRRPIDTQRLAPGVAAARASAGVSPALTSSASSPCCAPGNSAASEPSTTEAPSRGTIAHRARQCSDDAPSRVPVGCPERAMPEWRREKRLHSAWCAGRVSHRAGALSWRKIVGTPRRRRAIELRAIVRGRRACS